MKTQPRRLRHALGDLLDPLGACSDRTPAMTDQDWQALYRLAAGHLVSPALYARLAQRRRLVQVPGEIRAALKTLHELNDQRNRRLRGVLRETALILNRAGIAPVLLKGAVALLPDQYPHAFARMMGDLDLGVTPPATERAADALRTAGYYSQPGFERAGEYAGSHHLAPLAHPSGAGYVEIHHALFDDSAAAAALSLPMLEARAQTVTWNGVQVRIPTLEHRLLHNALHHQFSDGAFRYGLRSVRQLLEFAHLRAMPTAGALDWPALLRRLDRVGVGDAIRGYLLAALDLFGQPLPAGVEPTAAALRADDRFAFRLEHPRLGRSWQWLDCFARRLSRLPACLVVPAWYPKKYRSLRRQWLRSQASGEK